MITKYFLLTAYDIKRIFGRGKIAVLALASPLIVILLVAVVVFPLVVSAGDISVPYAVYEEDESEEVRQFIDFIVKGDALRKASTPYPVKDFETGMNLLENDKVSVFVYVPGDFYQRMVGGEDAVLEMYYYPRHTFEAEMIKIVLNSSLSVVGKSRNILSVAWDIVFEGGKSAEESDQFVNDCIVYDVEKYMQRKKILGSEGTFSELMDFMPLEFYLSALFSLCALFAIFPGLYLTSLDEDKVYRRIACSTGRRVRAYFIRLLSSAVFVIASISLMIPMALLIQRFGLYWAKSASEIGIIALIFSLPIIGICFSSIGVTIGSFFKDTVSAIWTGLYVCAGMTALSGIFISEYALPKPLAFIGNLLPLKSVINIIGCSMFAFDPLTFLYSIIKILAFAVCLILIRLLVFLLAGWSERRHT